jgi:hypothetical protein
MPHPQPAHNVLARYADRLGVEMDLYTPGVALAAARIAELHRQADGQRLANRLPGRTAARHQDRAPGSRRRPDRDGEAAARAGGPGRATTEAAMLIQHQHKPAEFDPGHYRTYARQAGLLDHYDRVQREEAYLRQTRARAHAARRYALWALSFSSVGILLAAVALLTR